MSDLVSIIVPVYKVESYLKRCVDSIALQTYTNLEIILVDDGSPDRCGKMCDEYAEKDDRITVIHKENAGLGYARNSGIAVCKGDYVMFVDSDDYLSLDCVEILYNRLIADGSDMAVGKHTDIYDDGSLNGFFCKWRGDCALSREAVLEGMGSNIIPVAAWGKLYKRDVIKKISYPPLKCGEDKWAFVDVMKSCEKISLSDHVIYYYYQRSDSIFHSLDEVKKTDIMKADLRLIAYLFQENKIQSATAFYNHCITVALTVKKMSERTVLFHQYLDRKTIRLLLKENNWKTKIKWCGLYIPYFNKVKNLLRKRHEKE